MTLQAALILVDGLGALTFVVSYAALTRWWTSGIGWQMMTFMIIVSALLGLRLAALLLPPWPGQQNMFTVMYIALGAVLWWLPALLWHTWLHERKRKSNSPRL